MKIPIMAEVDIPTSQYVAGDRIFSQGDQGEIMFVIISGRVRLFKEVEGERTELGLLGKGDFFGEMSLLSRRKRYANAEAIEPTEVMEIGLPTLLRMLHDRNEIGLRMLHNLMDRIEAAERLLSEVAGESETELIDESFFLDI